MSKISPRGSTQHLEGAKRKVFKQHTWGSGTERWEGRGAWRGNGRSVIDFRGESFTDSSCVAATIACDGIPGTMFGSRVKNGVTGRSEKVDEAD